MKVNIQYLIALSAFLTLPLSFINPDYKDLAKSVTPPAIIYLLKEGDKQDKDK